MTRTTIMADDALLEQLREIARSEGVSLAEVFARRSSARSSEGVRRALSGPPHPKAASQYSDLPLGFVDAAVVAVAERLEETTTATLDRRYFSVVKPVHCEAFTLVP